MVSKLGQHQTHAKLGISCSLIDEDSCISPEEQDRQCNNQHMRYQSQEMVFDNFEQNPKDSCTTDYCSWGFLVFPQQYISSWTRLKQHDPCLHYQIILVDYFPKKGVLFTTWHIIFLSLAFYFILFSYNRNFFFLKRAYNRTWYLLSLCITLPSSNAN